jgi:hypothetical protein
VGALANDQVGDYLNRHFVSSFVKVGTFALVNGQKQGGNVASYFCLPDGSVLHAIAGPVDAATMLHEARWVVDTHKLASFLGQNEPAKYRDVFANAHAERLQREFGVSRGSIARFNKMAGAAAEGSEGSFTTPNDPVTSGKMRVLMMHRNMDNRGRVHLLLALFPQVKVQDIYKYVFEDMLKEKVSALPVNER